jgi:methionyl-tRNA formyltransferase
MSPPRSGSDPDARPILFLGRDDSAILAYLRQVEPEVVAIGPDVVVTAGHLAPDPSIVVVHGYRRILPPETLRALPATVVNGHISLLPWNRGADPNLWSVLEDTPTGVTIHHVDAGVDTGDVITQTPVEIDDDETLATSYQLLQRALSDLFATSWAAIRAGTAPRVPQPPGGSVHRVADRAAVEHLLTDGWDTGVGRIRGARADSRLTQP